MSFHGAMAHQMVRAIGARELAHETQAVLREVCDGTRLVVTKHREPIGVIMSVRDAVEALLLSSGELEIARAADPGDVIPRGAVEAWPPGLFPNLAYELCAPAALASHTRMRRVRSRDRVALVRTLAAEPGLDSPSLVWSRSGRWLFACSPVGPRLGVLHGLFDAADLERELMGEELWLARERQYSQRSLHGRMPRGAPARRTVPPTPNPDPTPEDSRGPRDAL